jgi:hypothetical protein
VIVLLVLLESTSHDVPLGTIGYGSDEGPAASGRAPRAMGVERNSCRMREIRAKNGPTSARVGAGRDAALLGGMAGLQVPDRGTGRVGAV